MNVNEESNLHSIKQPPKGPNCKQSITNSHTTATNSLPPPICQSNIQTNYLTSAQSSSEMDTDQCDIIDDTIKQVTHKLHQTIVTSNIDNIDLDRATSTIPNKPITTPCLFNPREDGTTTPQFPKTPDLQPTSSDLGNQ